MYFTIEPALLLKKWHEIKLIKLGSLYLFSSGIVLDKTQQSHPFHCHLLVIETGHSQPLPVGSPPGCLPVPNALGSRLQSLLLRYEFGLNRGPCPCHCHQLLSSQPSSPSPQPSAGTCNETSRLRQPLRARDPAGSVVTPARALLPLGGKVPRRAPCPSPGELHAQHPWTPPGGGRRAVLALWAASYPHLHSRCRSKFRGKHHW